MLLNSGVGTFFTISTGGRTGATVAILHRQLDSSAAGGVVLEKLRRKTYYDDDYYEQMSVLPTIFLFLILK